MKRLINRHEKTHKHNYIQEFIHDLGYWKLIGPATLL